MSYDSFLAYRESLEGIQVATLPPMHVYLFEIFRPLGVGGLFYFQSFLLFLSAGLILSELIPRLRYTMLALVAFGALFWYFPTMLGTMIVIWKDGAMAGFALFGIAAWLIAARRSSYAWLFTSIVAFSVALALRYNSLPLVAFVLLLLVAAPFGRFRQRRESTIAAVAVLIGLFGAYASLTWRLPDFQRLPPGVAFTGIQEFDLTGMSACTGVDLLPLAATGGTAMSADQIRQAYDPRAADMSYIPGPGKRALAVTDASGELGKLWAQDVVRYFGCYVAHRDAVFVELMGLDAAAVYYPTNGGIDPNKYGIALANPAQAQGLIQFIVSGSNELWRRPAILYPVALLVTILLWWSRSPSRLLVAAMLFGSLGYIGALYFVAPTADARYTFPSNAFCALILAMGFAQLVAGWTSSRALEPARRAE